MNQQSITFGLFTDPHYAKRPSRNRRSYGEALKRISRCLDTFAREQVDFAVCLGDLVDHPEDPEAGRRELCEIGEHLAVSGLEFHLALGNHDVDTLSRETVLTLCGLHAKPYYSFDRGGFHFVVLDSNYDPKGNPYLPGENVWDNTYLGEAQLEWLRADLSLREKQPIILLVHANLDPIWDGELLNPHVIRDADKARSILEAHPSSVTVFQGHYHPGREWQEHGIAYHTLPGIVELEDGTYCLTVHADAEGITCREWR